MNRIILLSFCILFSTFVFAQKAEKKSRKTLKAEHEVLIAAKVDSILNSKSFVFVAHSASPVQMQTVQLSSQYDLRVKADSVMVYLPYYGRVYQVNPLSEGGIKLNNTMEGYTVEQRMNLYIIKFKASSEYDVYNFQLSVSKMGYCTLHVISNYRQPISYSGVLDNLGL
ncbi:MAG TPA: DUF4251 domain-containing protein [Prolixibacteraceae bacterium]|nr:DUF4251 domain-containing protein [Prolixibacteraceae bacterium]